MRAKNNKCEKQIMSRKIAFCIWLTSAKVSLYPGGLAAANCTVSFCAKVIATRNTSDLTQRACSATRKIAANENWNKASFFF